MKHVKKTLLIPIVILFAALVTGSILQAVELNRQETLLEEADEVITLLVDTLNVLDAQNTVIRESNATLREDNTVMAQDLARGRECIWAPARIKDSFGWEYTFGDISLCGRNLKWGNIKGPSQGKLYDKGGPLRYGKDNGKPVPVPEIIDQSKLVAPKTDRGVLR